MIQTAQGASDQTRDVFSDVRLNMSELRNISTLQNVQQTVMTSHTKHLYRQITEYFLCNIRTDLRSEVSARFSDIKHLMYGLSERQAGGCHGDPNMKQLFSVTSYLTFRSLINMMNIFYSLSFFFFLPP